MHVILMCISYEYAYLKIAYLMNTLIKQTCIYKLIIYKRMHAFTLIQGYYILYTQTVLLCDEYVQFIVNTVVKSEVKIKRITDNMSGH